MDLESLRARISSSDALLLFFSEPACQVGAAVAPKTLALISEEFPRVEVVEIDTVASPTVAAQLGVLTIPTLVLFFAGRETARFVRTFGIDEVRQALERPYAVLFG